MLKFTYLQKALAIINSELELLNLKIRYPEQFQQSEPATFESDLYILPKSKDLGIVALGEIVIALFLSKKVFQQNGKSAHLNQIAYYYRVNDVREFVREHADVQTYREFDRKHPRAKDKDKTEE